jgi:hypothetical protein
VSRATLLHLDEWIASGKAPPPNRLMPLEPATREPDVLQAPKYLPNAIVERPKRDADGNVVGGVRLPDVPFRSAPMRHDSTRNPLPACWPVPSYRSRPPSRSVRRTTTSACRFAERYKKRDDYVNWVHMAARSLETDGFLLPDDAAIINAAAAATRAVK